VSTASWKDTILIIVGAGFACLWAGVTLYGGLRIYRIVEPSVISPELTVIRAIADAILSSGATKPRIARSFSSLKTVAGNVSKAANLLERTMLQQLAHNDKTVENIIRPQLEAAAEGLRSNLALLANPTADSIAELNKSLGQALVGAATGNFSQFASPDAPARTVSGPPWQDRLAGLLRRLALALVPGLVVILAIRWGLIPEAFQTWAGQFAVLCFIYATFSSLGQAGQDELSGVIGSGTSLFGWGKPKE
jgi:hypothetical protein